MSAPPTTAGKINPPAPCQERQPSAAHPATHTSRLLGLVRTLIEYGRQLATTLQERASGTRLADVARNFGTLDLAAILASITRGLQLAAAFEARLASRLVRQQAAPAVLSVPSRHDPRGTRSTRPSISAAGANPAHLPTPEDIAAAIRRRPLGAVLADICRDLGIVASHPLWREISHAIIRHDGNLATLVKDIGKRLSIWVIDPNAAARLSRLIPRLPAIAACGTGPP